MTAHPEDHARIADTFDPKKFLDIAEHYGHGAALGYKYQDHGEDWVEMSLPFRPEIVGVPETGILASGAIISLVDACGGAAVWQKMGKFEPIATVDLRLDYLRPALAGDTLLARCECYRVTKSIAFVRGKAFIDEERVVANVVGTYIRNP